VEHMPKALITGASRGIGQAIKTLLQHKGVIVFSPSRSEMDLKSCQSIKDYVVNIPEDIDILINNAGINELVELENSTEQQVQEMLQVNLVSQIELIKLLSPQMKKRKYGRIVNLSSIWSSFSKERRALYSIAKAGVNGLTISAAVELSSYNILVNAIAPGFVNTEMTSQNNTPEQIAQIAQNLPIKRLAEPKEIAEAVYFLASEKNTFITGQTIFVDGGFSCI
jgi:NAD(P)-dependent dehydrogenase (short-subunit alcohol dehydrogenase family)